MIIYAHEHFQYSTTKGIVPIGDDLTALTYSRYPKDMPDQPPYYLMTKDIKSETGQYVCETNYYVGLDWVVENKKAIFVAPKQNICSESSDDDIKIDHLTMLFEALEEPQNIPHLQGLCEIDFHQAMIPFPQAQDELSVFLIIEYLQVLRHLVKRGLKKHYYQETKLFNGRVKGKIAIDASLKQQSKKQITTHNVCTYQVFGINHDENKLLKKAYVFAVRYLAQYPTKQFDALQATVNYIRPAFNDIDDDLNIKAIKSFKVNTLYKEYEQATRLAQVLLKRFAYNSAFSPQSLVPTPPYWINMAQLFELYVFKKLKDVFPESGAIKYHQKAHYQEIDFVLNTKDENNKPIQMVIDTKYKPKYDKTAIQKDDARQLSGYTRLKKVYKELGITDMPYPIIDALIIYPDRLALPSIEIKKIKEYEHYVQFYKLGISLPER